MMNINLPSMNILCSRTSNFLIGMHASNSLFQRNCNRNLFSKRRIFLIHNLYVPSIEVCHLINLGVRNFSSKAGKVVITDEKMESWEMLVDLEKLTALEKKIHERHKNAVKVH